MNKIIIRKEPGEKTTQDADKEKKIEKVFFRDKMPREKCAQISSNAFYP